MRQEILSNWNFMRFIRLALGIAIIIQSVMVKDWGMAIMGVVFTSMPLFNIGCCGVNGCAVPQKKNTETTKEITYEEVA